METGGSGSMGRFVRTGVNVTRGLNFGRGRVAPIITVNDTSSEIDESDNNQVSQTNENADHSIILMPNSSDGESSNDDQTEGANANESQGTSDGKIAYDNKKQKVNSDIACEIQQGQSNIQVFKPSNETADHSVILMPGLSDGESRNECQQAVRAANSDTEHTNESERIGKSSSQDQQVNTDQGDSTKNATTQKVTLKKPSGKRTDKLNPRKVTTSLLDINIKSDIKASAETVIKNIKPVQQFQASKTSSTNSSTESLDGNKDSSQIEKKVKTLKVISLGGINEGASTSKGFAPKPNPISHRKSTTNEDGAPKITNNELIRRLIKKSVVRNATKTPKAYRRASKGIQTSHFATLLQKYVEISKRKKAKQNDKDSDDEVIYTAEDFHNDLTKNTWRGILRRLRKWQPSKNNILWWFIKEFIKRFKPPGFKEAVKEGISLFMRFYWVILTLLLLYFGTHYVIQDALDNHQQPTTFTLNRNEIDTGDIPFYSLTFCSTCVIKRSAVILAEIIYSAANAFGTYVYNGVTWTENEAAKLISLIYQRCSDRNSASNLANQEMSYAEQIEEISNVTLINDPRSETSQKIIGFLKMAQPQLEDVALYCAMNGKQVDCKDVFTKTQTEYGTCYTSNKIPDEVKYKHHNTFKQALDWRSVTSSDLNAWKKYVLDDLDFETGNFKDMDKNSTVIPFQRSAGVTRGLTVVFTNPEECGCKKGNGLGWNMVAHMPTEEPDMSKGILIAPNTAVHLGVIPRITMGHPDIMDLTMEQRGCVYSNQVQLKYFNIYTESNCLEECLIDAILKDCECVEFFRAGPPGQPFCKPSQQQCIINATDTLRSKQRRVSCPKCLPDCTRITLRTEFSSTPLDPENKFMEQFKKVNQTHSIVYTGYVVSTVPANLRKMELTTGQQIAQVGGTYGLTNGFSIIDVLRFLYAFIWLMYELWKRKILQYLFRAIKNVFKRIWRSLKKKAGCKIEGDPKNGRDDNDNPEMDLQIERKSESNQVEIDECNLTIEILAKIKMLETKLRKKNHKKRVKRSQKQKQIKPQQSPTALDDYISDEEPATQLMHISVAQLEKVFQDWNNAREERRLRDEEAERILAPPLIPIPWKPKGRVSEIRDRFARRRPGTTGHTGRARAEAAVPEGTFRRQGAMRRRRGHTRTHIYWPRLQAAILPTINYTTDYI